MLGPLRFIPHVRPLVWGGRRLGDILGKTLPPDDSFGESWEVSDHPSHRSVVASGPHRGKTIRQLMEDAPHDLLGRDAPTFAFPWLLKYLDARDWLSVQVHPDDDRAKRLWPGEGGKTEAWFVLDAEPTSRVYAGLLPGVNETDLRAALRNGTVAKCLHQFRPQTGDCLFLKAGTVHAVGGGVLLAEIQQTSDATFRLFDWNRRDAEGRSRKLHIEDALTCIDWKAGPVTPVRAEGFTEGFAPVQQKLVVCPYFTLEYICTRDTIALGGVGQLQALMVVKGRGRIPSIAEDPGLKQGDTVVLPASTPVVHCRAEGTLGVLVATLPRR